MVSLEDALERLLAATIPLPMESVAVERSSGRVAAEDVHAPGPVPHFPRPAMDGYVCHDADIRNASSDHPVTLRLSGTVRMGEAPGSGPALGEAWSITTGAAMPARGDRVLPLESVRRIGADLRIERDPGSRTNVAAPGEDIRGGVRLITTGEMIEPPAAGAVAACGLSRVHVYRRPRVALVATGDELIDVGSSGEAVPPGRVFNSNAVTLGGLLRSIGCEVEYKGIVRDQPDEMRATFAALHEGQDVVLSTGGVSVGRYDAVHRTWLDLGTQRILGRVDLKPGGPFFAGRLGHAWVLGLSGTPVACLAAYHLLGRPFFARLGGRRHAVRPLAEGTLTTGFPKATDGMRALWARVDRGAMRRPMVELLRGPEIGNFASLLGANALVLIPPGTPPLPPGSRVTAMLLDREEDRDRLMIGRPSPGPIAIGVVGESGSGKTTLIVELLRRLARDGIRAVAVKHAAHGFDVDRAGSDSARMLEAGAALVALAGPAETLMRIPAPVAHPEQLASMAAEVAARVWETLPVLVLIEGFRHANGLVIQVGPQKAGADARQVLASVPALTKLSEDVVSAEVCRVAEIVRARIR